jgi:hypothetical protein
MRTWDWARAWCSIEGTIMTRQRTLGFSVMVMGLGLPAACEQTLRTGKVGNTPIRRAGWNVSNRADRLWKQAPLPSAWIFRTTASTAGLATMPALMASPAPRAPASRSPAPARSPCPRNPSRDRTVTTPSGHRNDPSRTSMATAVQISSPGSPASRAPQARSKSRWAKQAVVLARRRPIRLPGARGHRGWGFQWRRIPGSVRQYPRSDPLGGALAGSRRRQAHTS